MKTWHTDNGGEYIPTYFKAYLTKKSIRHELTEPETLQQNGVSERMNQTLVESV